jgi:hypothetical protein
MGAIKERYQNPVQGDTVILRLFFYNSNNFSNVSSIDQVELFLVAKGSSASDTSARTLKKTIKGASVIQDGTGQYYIEVALDSIDFEIGNYVDVWTVNFTGDFNDTEQITNVFTIYPNLWYTAPIPVVYDFNFQFRPAKIRKGSKRYIIIQVTPNVPKGTDLQRYYENLAVVGNLFVSIEQRTGACLPEETDLRMIAEKVPVTFREMMYGYYQIDTTDMEIGIYDIWFELDLGDNVYISDRNQIQIFN